MSARFQYFLVDILAQSTFGMHVRYYETKVNGVDKSVAIAEVEASIFRELLIEL